MNLAVLGLVTSYEVVFDLCRKRGSRDLLQQGELRAILCGAWRFALEPAPKRVQFTCTISTEFVS
jgi:hypothetical protein